MPTTLFREVQYTLSKLIQDIDLGEIGLPDIQRPFVWKAAQVRDLFDSMYRGFPVGHLLFWSNESVVDAKQIGTDPKQTKIPRLLIVDGQQRLTSLYAVFKGKPVLDDDYREVYLRIAFHPGEERFEVSDAAIARDPEFIPDISQLWADRVNTYRFIQRFLSNLRNHRTVDDSEEERISDSIGKLYDLINYPFTALEISSTVSEEEVAEIFVRINSKGVQLNQSDFILTLLSVFWEEGRIELERFSRQAKRPAKEEASPFNYFIEPSPDQLLRVAVGLGFRRARLQNVYPILRGKDLETGQYSPVLRDQHLSVLKEAQRHVLHLQNWHDFFKVLVRAGFRSGNMIGSQNGILYTYVMYLIGKVTYGIDPYVLRNVLAKWYFMVSLTGRYTNAPETTMEADLNRLRGIRNGEEFIRSLERTIENTLTPDFWNITLVNQLESASAQSPALYAYFAALNLLDAHVLFSKMKVAELLDPAVRGQRKAIEKHHLFPRDYLKSELGIQENRLINQAANYALVEWPDNTRISNDPPYVYWPRYSSRFNEEERSKMMEWHALWPGWEQCDYYEFLAERRRRMAQVIRAGFERLNA